MIGRTIVSFVSAVSFVSFVSGNSMGSNTLGTGKGVQLNNIEMSLWDTCSGFALTIKLTKSADTEEKIIDISQWFKQNNPEAHKILFLDNLLFENTIPIYLLYKIR